MTLLEKNTVENLRKQGVSYKVISQKTKINISTIKSHCKRNGFTNKDLERKENSCEQCGQPLGESTHKAKRFCSYSCRMTWWKENSELVNRKAIYNFTCIQCGVEFESYSNKDRKYCSRHCYAVSRHGNKTARKPKPCVK